MGTEYKGSLRVRVGEEPFRYLLNRCKLALQNQNILLLSMGNKIPKALTVAAKIDREGLYHIQSIKLELVKRAQSETQQPIDLVEVKVGIGVLGR